MHRMEPESTQLDNLKRWLRFTEGLLVHLRDADVPGETRRAGIAFAAEMTAAVRILAEKFTVGKVDGHDTVYFDDIPF